MVVFWCFLGRCVDGNLLSPLLVWLLFGASIVRHSPVSSNDLFSGAGFQEQVMTEACVACNAPNPLWLLVLRLEQVASQCTICDFFSWVTWLSLGVLVRNVSCVLVDQFSRCKVDSEVETWKKERMSSHLAAFGQQLCVPHHVSSKWRHYQQAFPDSPPRMRQPPHSLWIHGCKVWSI